MWLLSSRPVELPPHLLKDLHWGLCKGIGRRPGGGGGGRSGGDSAWNRPAALNKGQPLHVLGAEKDGTPVEQASGPNSCSYFVCTDLGSGPMTRLPEVRPSQIKVARQLKRFLTGRLDSEVQPHPLLLLPLVPI